MITLYCTTILKILFLCLGLQLMKTNSMHFQNLYEPQVGDVIKAKKNFFTRSYEIPAGLIMKINYIKYMGEYPNFYVNKLEDPWEYDEIITNVNFIERISLPEEEEEENIEEIINPYCTGTKAMCLYKNESYYLCTLMVMDKKGNWTVSWDNGNMSDRTGHPISHFKNILEIGIEEKNCNICYKNCSVHPKPPCNHDICYVCLLKIFEEGNKKCPSCRKNLPDPQKLEKYKFIGTKNDKDIPEILFAQIVHRLFYRNIDVPKTLVPRVLYLAMKFSNLSLMNALMHKGHTFENEIAIALQSKNMNFISKEVIDFLTEKIIIDKNFKNDIIANRIANHAVKSNNLELVKKLTEKGYDFTNQFLNSVKTGNLKMVKFLMFNTEVDIQQKDKNGKTAIQIAEEMNRFDIKNFLLQADIF